MRLGKDKQAISLVVFLLLSASAGGQTLKNHKYQLDGNLQVIDVVTENNNLIINYSIPELNIENTENTEGQYYRVTIPGHTPTVNTGKPELPVYNRLISIPEGAEYKIKITDVKTVRIHPSAKKIDGLLIPAQEGRTKAGDQLKSDFKIDRTIYSQKGFITSDTVKIERLGILRKINLANIEIIPVRYNPRSNTLEVISSMKIEISFSNSTVANTKSASPKSILFNETLLKGVLNYNPGEVTPGFTDQPVKMVIITDPQFKNVLKPFLKWKTQKGYKLEILYKGTGNVGSSYIQLKDTLAKIYKTSSAVNPPPDYLLIIGDVSRIPYYGSGGTGNVTDMYYGEFDDGGDYIPEMYIGRLPVADTSELKNVIQKIIQYEKFQYADSNKFYSYALATAGNDEVYSTQMNGQVKYAVSNYLTPSNGITERHFYYPSANTAKDTIIKIINKGISFLNYTGHGDATGWLYIDKVTPPASSGIKAVDIPSFKNKNMYPLVISNACRTAQFNIANSFGNKMVVTGDKGAIGFIGCSNDSYWDEDFYWAVGPGNITANPTYPGKGLGAYDRLFHTHNEPPSEWYSTFGQINYAGNLAVSSSTSSRKKYYWETYNVIGDPSIIPITGKPGQFKISLPDTLPNAMKSLTLNLDPFAYIAVSHNDTLWDASFASNSGSVVLELPGLSNDSCLFVITGQNKYPVIKTVHFSNISKEYLNLTSTSINDIEGNKNNLADYGESIFLKLAINNLGSTDAQNVIASISSKSSWITIKSDTAIIGTIKSKSEIVVSDKLNLTISSNVPDMAVATVDLIIKDNKTVKHYTIDFVIHSPDPQIINCIIDDKALGDCDFIADPGESFDLIFRVSNNGSSDTPGQLTVASQTQELTLLESGIKSGVLKFSESMYIPIKVKLSEAVPSGSYFSVNSTLNCAPFVMSKDFSFRVGMVRESFETSSFNVFPWINTSLIPWIIIGNNSVDGTVSARSGNIPHNTSTSLILKTVYQKADSLKFYYKVSSELSYDNLSFSLNGKEILKKSGEISWTKTSIPVPAGPNKFEWKFKKDQSVSSGSDCAWIDLIDFTVDGAVTYIQKDLKVAKIAAPLQKDKFGLETVTVKVLNTGKDILNGFNLAYRINDNSTPVEQFFENQVLPDGDTVTVSFKVKADMNKYGPYKIITYGFNNKDDFSKNDTLQIKLENTSIDENLTIFPNPFQDHFTLYINSSATENVTISIVNLSGIEVYKTEKHITKGNNSIVMTVPHLAPSLYYLNIRGSVTYKSAPILKVIK